MAYATIDLDDYIVDFSDEELIGELKSRGYKVLGPDEFAEPEFIDAIYRWERGEKKESLILLERQIPELVGLARLAD